MRSVWRDLEALSRRGVLRGAVALAALRAVRPSVAQGVVPLPAFASDPFPLGVASGDPWPDGFVIWTRVGPDPLNGGDMPPGDVEVGWEVGEDSHFSRIVARGTGVARASLNHAVHVEVAGLRPGRPYFYRFLVGVAASPTGRTRTAPAADAMPGRLRIVSAGCQRYEHGWFTAWRHIAEEPDLDLVLHYGDYIYEYPMNASRTAVRRDDSAETRTLEDYRRRYALYHLDPDLRAAHAAHPFAVSFDDHEVENNWTGDHGPRSTSAEFALRKAAALQAWYEAMPVRRAVMPRGRDIAAWRALPWGRLADIAVLDTRSFRDVQPCGDGVKPACAEVGNAAAQVLGPAQEAWLTARLTGPGPAWRIVAQQVMMMRRDFGASANVVGPRFNMDSWDGYPAARARLLGAVRDVGTRNLVVLTGDVHAAWAGTLRASEGDAPEVGVEFVATSVTSGGDGSETTAGAERALPLNPHIAFTNNRRGYTVVEADATRLTATYRALPYVSRPGAPLEERGRFVVESGRAALLRG